MAIRTQIYLSEEQKARLVERGRRQGVAMAQLIREAIDDFLVADDDMDATFGSVPEIGTRVPPRAEWGSRG